MMLWTGISIAVAVAVFGVRLWWFTHPPRIHSRSGCPLITWSALLSHQKIEPGDYIELRVAGGSPVFLFEPVHVRIYGSGLVQRETTETVRGYTFGCPLHQPDMTLHIPKETAQALIAKARDGGFCSLCSTYQYPGRIYDAGVEEITLRLGSRIKTVWDHAGKPPKVFGEMEDQIWDLSNIASVADTRKFSAGRAAECEKFSDTQERQYESRHGEELKR